MAITTLSGLRAGYAQPFPFIKNASTGTQSSSSSARAVTSWYVSGNEQAGANASGVNGQNVVYPRNGAVRRVNPPAGQNAYLASIRAKLFGSTNVSVMIVDRLWENSGLSVTSTTAQTITMSGALPARDVNGATSGEGVLAAIEWSVGSGAGTPTVSLSYTNSSGVSGRTASFLGTASSITSSWEFFNLDTGDTGIRSVQSLTQSATRTSGTMHLVLFRPLCQFELPGNYQSAVYDALTMGMPRIYDDTCYQVLFIPGNQANNAMAMTLQEVYG